MNDPDRSDPDSPSIATDGVLCLARSESLRTWTVDDLALLDLVGQILASVQQRLRLRVRCRRHATSWKKRSRRGPRNSERPTKSWRPLLTPYRMTSGLHVHGDPPLVGLVLQNLIGNAWKFTVDRE